VTIIIFKKTSMKKENNILFSFFVFFCFGFYVTQTQYSSFGDVPALLVEADLRCPSVDYFRHERAE
jgi:hypothetical protein